MDGPVGGVVADEPLDSAVVRHPDRPVVDQVPHDVGGRAGQRREPLGVRLDGVPYLHVIPYRTQPD